MLRIRRSIIEYWILAYANCSRKRAGLPPMVINNRLTSLARSHSRYMAKSGKLFHNQDAGFENIAIIRHSDLPESELAKQFHWQWMGSTRYQQNVLHPQNNQMGIGVVRAGQYYYATQKFDYEEVQAYPVKKGIRKRMKENEIWAGIGALCLTFLGLFLLGGSSGNIFGLIGELFGIFIVGVIILYLGFHYILIRSRKNR
jgi:hypothetical protein